MHVENHATVAAPGQRLDDGRRPGPRGIVSGVAKMIGVGPEPAVVPDDDDRLGRFHDHEPIALPIRTHRPGKKITRGWHRRAGSQRAYRECGKRPAQAFQNAGLN
jgi:hypothetical protein